MEGEKKTKGRTCGKDGERETQALRCLNQICIRAPNMGGTRSIWGREQRQELTRWRKRKPYSAAEGYAVSLRACEVVFRVPTDRRVRLCRRPRGVGVGDTRIVASSGQLFGRRSMEKGPPGDALSHFRQARLSLLPGALNFVHIKPSTQRRVPRPSAFFAFRKLHHHDRGYNFTLIQHRRYDLRIETLYQPRPCLTRAVTPRRASQMMRLEPQLRQ